MSKLLATQLAQGVTLVCRGTAPLSYTLGKPVPLPSAFGSVNNWPVYLGKIQVGIYTLTRLRELGYTLAPAV